MIDKEKAAKRVSIEKKKLFSLRVREPTESLFFETSSKGVKVPIFTEAEFVGLIPLTSVDHTSLYLRLSQLARAAEPEGGLQF